MFYFACCINIIFNIIFNSLLAQLVKYDVHTTRKIKFIHAICCHILLLSSCNAEPIPASAANLHKWRMASSD